MIFLLQRPSFEFKSLTLLFVFHYETVFFFCVFVGAQAERAAELAEKKLLAEEQEAVHDMQKVLHKCFIELQILMLCTHAYVCTRLFGGM